MLAFLPPAPILLIHAVIIAWSVAASAPVAIAQSPASAAPERSLVAPETVGLRSDRLQQMDAIVQQAIDAHQMPGCVVAVGRHGRLAWLKAYGQRQLQPTPAPMTVDTVFDLASITKPVATATSILLLCEQGRVRLRDPVANYLPELNNHGKDAITITQLLTHQSGLLPDNSLSDYEQGADEAWQRLAELELQEPPGTKFLYSDVGFIVLGELVRRTSGLNVHEFSQRFVFQPLAMRETTYLPDETLRARAAPTEMRDGQWLQGVVHDPRAARLGGIAGHAGLFSTAPDLARYAQMMLQRGRLGNARILSPPSVTLMTASQEVAGNLRGLGWDKLSVYSSNRGENFSAQAFGHGGFTGTVLWIDPTLDLYFIFLSNRVHPDGSGNVNATAGRLATIAAGAIDDDRAAPFDHEPRDAAAAPATTRLTTRVGLEELVRQDFRPLQGQRVGLITNHTGRTAAGERNVDLLHAAANVRLTAIFSPEHGVDGRADTSQINDSRDAATGLPIYSLYGATRAPTAAQLEAVDTLVFDVQDAGARFYTYVSTLRLAMQAAATHHKRFVVLDRPNPVGGAVVEGPVLDAGRESFTAPHALPIRHGMTVGELAQLFVADLALPLELQVIPMAHWQRASLFDQTGLPWINPSPNLRSVNAALLYTGIGLLETTNLSVGRGTDTPFERLGAPWIDELQLATALNAAGLPGLTFTPLRFTPHGSVYAGLECHGVQLTITQRDALNPLDVGFQVASTLHQLYPADWTIDDYQRLLQDDATWRAIQQDAPRDVIRAGYADELKDFIHRRQPFLLY